MYFGHIQQISNIEKLYPAPIVRLLKIFGDLDFSMMESKRFDVDGDNIHYAISDITTKNAEMIRPETHQHYIDVQLLLTGREQIGITIDKGNYPIVENLYAEKDIAFYDAQTPDEVLVRAHPGNFTIIFPNEIHRPGSAVTTPETIRKVVGKIRVDLL